MHLNIILRSEITVPIEPEPFTKLLEKVYESSENLTKHFPETPLDISPFVMDELVHALKKMRNGRCADTSNIVVEMIKHAGDAFLT